MPHTGEPVQIRVGIHTGDLVSGVVGTKLPKVSTTHTHTHTISHGYNLHETLVRPCSMCERAHARVIVCERKLVCCAILCVRSLGALEIR